MNRDRGLLARIEDLLIVVARVSLATIAIVVVANVVSRYVFDAPLTFTNGLTERYLLVAVVYLALSSGESAGVHVRVTVFTRMLPPALSRVLRVVTLLLSAVYFAGITAFSGEQASHAWAIHQTSAGLTPWPMYVAYTIVPVGTLLMTVRLLRNAATLARESEERSTIGAELEGAIE